MNLCLDVGSDSAPATDVIGELLKRCPNSLTGNRDRALIALGFASAFSRSELVALEVVDLTETPNGLRVIVRRSKTDQTEQGQEVATLRGRRLRPVGAVQAWLSASGVGDGPGFCQVNKSGRVLPGALSEDRRHGG